MASTRHWGLEERKCHVHRQRQDLGDLEGQSPDLDHYIRINTTPDTVVVATTSYCGTDMHSDSFQAAHKYPKLPWTMDRLRKNQTSLGI